MIGWGNERIKNFGPVHEDYCPHCKNKSHWQLHSLTVWLTFFFVPIFPSEKKYFLTCPACGLTVDVDESDFERLKRIAEINMATSSDFFSCPSCGSVIPTGSRTCEGCDYEPGYTCPKCGADLDHGEETCKACGEPIGW